MNVKRKRIVMKHMMKKVTILAMVLLMLSFSMVGCGSRMDTTATIVTINGQEVPAGVANFFMRLSQAQVETYYAPMMGTTGSAMWGSPVDQAGTTYEELIREDIKTSFENLFIIAQQADAYGVSLSDADKALIEETIDTFIAANTQENLDLVSGQADYIREYLSTLMITRLMDPLMREGVDTNISDDEARQKAMEWVFFPFTMTGEDGSAVPMTDEQRAELVTTVDAFRQEVMSADGDMFAPAMVINTPDGETNEAADTTGLTVEVRSATFDETSRVVPAEIIDAAWNLSVNEVSDPIELDGGIYVVKQTSDLDREATDAKIANIIAEREQAQFDAKLTEWRDAAEITRNDRLWKSIRFDRLGVLIEQFSPEGDSASDDASPVEEDHSADDGHDHSTDAPAE